MTRDQEHRMKQQARQAATSDDDLGRQRSKARAEWWVGHLSHQLGIVDQHGMIDVDGEVARAFVRAYLRAPREVWPADTGRGRTNEAREIRYPKPAPKRHHVTPSSGDPWGDKMRSALGTIGHNRPFTARDLADYLRISTTDAKSRLNRLSRSGYVALDANGYHVTDLGWDWIEGGTQVSEATRMVADFDTLDDLIAHARDELGATHVVVAGPETRLYFPRGGQYLYEEARVWRKGGYWHAEGPGSRRGVARLPDEAQEIGGHSRRAAEPRVGEMRAPSKPRRPRVVRDYEAIDSHGRRIAGPFKSYSDAKHAAGTAGVVQYVRPGARRPGTSRS